MFKRFLCILLSGLTVILIISGCKTEKENESETSVPQSPAQGQLAGGWKINTDFENTEIPESIKAAFDKAVKKSDGLKAVAYLGSQVVAGTNYAFLCQDTKSDNAFYIVKVYNDLKGNASVLGKRKIDITDYTTDKEINYAWGASGAWTSENASGSALSGEVKSAFDKATKELGGIKYTPISYLASQVVAGTNYAVLCKSQTVTENPTFAVYVLIIYKDLNGNSKVTSICAFDYTE